MTESDNGQRVVRIGIKFILSSFSLHEAKSIILVSCQKPKRKQQPRPIYCFSLCRSRRPHTQLELNVQNSKMVFRRCHMARSGRASMAGRVRINYSLLSLDTRIVRHRCSVRTSETCPTAAARSPCHHGHPGEYRPRSKNLRLLHAGLGRRHRLP